MEHGCCMIMTRSLGEVFYWVLETSFPEGGSLSLSLSLSPTLFVWLVCLTIWLSMDSMIWSCDAVYVGETRRWLVRVSSALTYYAQARRDFLTRRPGSGPAGWGSRRRLFVQTAHRAMRRRRGERWGGHRGWQYVVGSRANGRVEGGRT